MAERTLTTDTQAPERHQHLGHVSGAAPEILQARRKNLPPLQRPAPSPPVLAIPPIHSAVELSDDLGFSYKPNPHSGERVDSFRYAYSEGGRCYTVTVSVNVRDCGLVDPPKSETGRAHEILSAG